MTLEPREATDFDERLLGELQRLMPVEVASTVTPARRRKLSRPWRFRLATAVAIGTAAAVAVSVLGPTNTTPALAITRSADGTVTVTIDSFEDPTGLERGLGAAGIPTMIQLIPTGQDCNAPQRWTPVPISDFPARFLPTASNPQASSPIDSGGVAHAPLTLILRYIPPRATLVIQSMRSAQLQPDNPRNTYALAISGPGRGIRIFWVQGHVRPCPVVATASAH